MKKFFCFALAIMMLFAFAACSNSSDGPAANGDNEVFADGDQYDEIGGELNILNWGEYIDPELITLFEEETGVKVNYVEMTSNEEMLIKLIGSTAIIRPSFFSSASLPLMLPTILPSNITSILSERLITSSNSKLTSSTALCLLR